MKKGATFDILLTGSDDLKILLTESGGHRWQRIPPTERKGRVHTSTVTVAVFEVKERSQWELKDSDIKTFTTKDSGPGGQHRNKTESCVIMRHLPTGIEAKASMKSQHQNKKTARAMLEARVSNFLSQIDRQSHENDRKTKVGSGMRGDKIRTYREQDDLVTDHISGKKARLSKILTGMLNLVK